MNKQSSVFFDLSFQPYPLHFILLCLPLFCFHFDRWLFIEDFFLQICHEAFFLKFSLENF